MKTFEEALAYARRAYEDVDIMLDPKTNEYHVIRLFGVEHWKQHYTTIAEVRVCFSVTAADGSHYILDPVK